MKVKHKNQHNPKKKRGVDGKQGILGKKTEGGPTPNVVCAKKKKTPNSTRLNSWGTILMIKTQTTVGEPGSIKTPNTRLSDRQGPAGPLSHPGDKEAGGQV